MDVVVAGIEGAESQDPVIEEDGCLAVQPGLLCRLATWRRHLLGLAAAVEVGQLLRRRGHAQAFLLIDDTAVLQDARHGQALLQP